MQKTKKIWKVALLVLAIALVLAAAAVVVSAYYSSRVYLYTDEVGEKRLFHIGMELNTFFDDIDPDKVNNGDDLGILCTDTSCGVLYTSGDMAKDTVYYKNFGTTEKPVYRYVFNADAVWGSASNPYIISQLNHLQNLYVLQNVGFFKVKFYTKAEGDTSAYTEADIPYFLVCQTDGKPVTINGNGKSIETVGNDEYPFVGYLGGAFNTTVKTTVGGKTSSQSAIYNVAVNTDNDIVDVGLFGCIGYLGDVSTATTDSEETGLQEFDGVVSTVRDLLLYDVTVRVKDKTGWTAIVDAAAHLFGFTSDSEKPHETNHIGILAGHVDYATIEYISVYYSNDNIAAIDVDRTSKSSTNVSANFFSVSGILGFINEMNSTQAGGKVTIGGMTNDNVIISKGGNGTGGGLESGVGRGYVTAAEIYQSFHDSGEIVKCTIPVTETNPDGTTYTTNTYKYGLVIVKDENNVLSYSSGNNTICSLQDKVTPVNIHKPDGSSTYVATIYADYESFFGTTRTITQDWAEFVVYDEQAGSYYYYKTGADSLSPVSIVESSGISMRYAAKYSAESDAFTNLCTQYERDRLIFNLEQDTNRWYFYDGVFTFALSDPTDTIEKTWDGTEADTFYVGDDNAANWKTVTTAGNKAVVSYVKQLKTTAELKAAGDAGKQVYIVYETTNDDGSKSEHLVLLADNSHYNEGDGEDALYTDYTTLNFVDSDMSEQLKETVAGGTIASPIAGVTNQELVANWNNYKILNVGSSQESGMSLTKLRSYYNTDMTFTSAATSSELKDQYGHTITSSTVSVTSGTGITEQLTKTWDYFIAFETNSASSNSSNTYWDGIVLYKDRYATLRLFQVTPSNNISLGSTTEAVHTKPSLFKQPYEIAGSVTPAGTSYGQNVYSFTYNGQVLTGPLLFLEDTKYYASWSRTNNNKIFAGSDTVSLTNGQYVTSYQVTNNYFLATVSDTGTTYKFNGAGSDISQPSVVDGETITINGVNYTVYTDGTHKGIMLTTTSTSGYYTFSSERENQTYTLRLFKRSGTLYGTRFSIISSTDAYVSSSNASTFKNGINVTPQVANTTQATVIPTGDGNTFYIAFQMDGSTRYLTYSNLSSGSTPYFHGSSSSNDACKMYIYTVEGSQNIDYGYVTYRPSSASAYNQSYSADEYVLWPNNVYVQSDETTQTYNPNNGSYTTDPTYSVKKLSNLQGFTTCTGDSLSFHTLNNVFSLGDGISDINIVSIWGGESATNFNSEYVKAPIGTTGEEAYIPTGCIAFRINKSGAANKIRVIVSVPVSDYYYGQTVGSSNTLMNPGEVDYSEDYYFCLWQCSEAGTATLNSINLSNCIQAFEIPRSNPYRPGTSATSTGDYIYDSSVTADFAASSGSVKSYITITDGSNQYRSYLNGSTVLVAYEFSASEEGVYVLGSTKECQIVYFSADASASGGKDGTTNYRIGTIDFVYDSGKYTISADANKTTTAATTGNTILTVRDTNQSSTASSDYGSYYFPSLDILYTKNDAEVRSGDTDVTGGFPNINNFTIYVRRVATQDGNGATIRWQATNYGTTAGCDAAYIQSLSYAVLSDRVTRKDDQAVERAAETSN